MISIIVCSRDPAQSDLHRRNVARTIGCAHEYMRIDNANGRFGICAAYNQGVSQAQGDILVFAHEDVFFLEPSWGAILEKKFGAREKLGVLGVAGTQYLFADPPGWPVAGRPFLHGKVVQQTGTRMALTVFSWDEGDRAAVVVDGLFFAVRAELFKHVRFDETTFDGFHFYDLDLCMQVRRTHDIMVTPDIMVKHLSPGSFDAVWQTYACRFAEKYRAELPASCCDAVPDLSRRIAFETFDITGRVSSETPV
jgi:glycosyltransferase involved in cell wall biosynthesis